MWEIEYTNEFEEWWETLSAVQQVALGERIDLLEQLGPRMRRPYVGEIKASKFAPQMKELICEAGGSLRVLFIFDPRRTAILLLGGDKTGFWDQWYETAIPAADRLYEPYLAELWAERGTE